MPRRPPRRADASRVTRDKRSGRLRTLVAGEGSTRRRELVRRSREGEAPAEPTCGLAYPPGKGSVVNDPALGSPGGSPSPMRPTAMAGLQAKPPSQPRASFPFDPAGFADDPEVGSD